MMQAYGMRNAALVVLGCDDPDLSGNFACDLFEYPEARRLDAVVVGEEDAIQHAAVPSVASRSPRAAAIRFFPADL
jgi:hypothetical protein